MGRNLPPDLSVSVVTIKISLNPFKRIICVALSLTRNYCLKQIENERETTSRSLDVA